MVKKKYVYPSRIDKPVAKFVQVLNQVNGVYPASSCGGHKCCVDPHQEPEGCFNVIMEIKNKQFSDLMGEIVDECNVGGKEAEFYYEPIMEMWHLRGSNWAMNKVLYPFVKDYLGIRGETKPKQEWNMYHSYGRKPVRENHKTMFGV